MSWQQLAIVLAVMKTMAYLPGFANCFVPNSCNQTQFSTSSFPGEPLAQLLDAGSPLGWTPGGCREAQTARHQEGAWDHF